jgi:long-chain acyl-CoA synthetase
MADEATTLAAIIEAQAEALNDEPFLYFEDRVISFSELNPQVNRAAHGLSALGVDQGVGVSIMMPNCPEWLFVFFATQKLGDDAPYLGHLPRAHEQAEERCPANLTASRFNRRERWRSRR